MNTHVKPPLLISACLIGLCTRYDGKIKEKDEWKKLQQEYLLIPICPEQLGGLPTPRPAADIEGGDGHDVLAGKASVQAKNGEDFTREFIFGAQQALEVAKKTGCQKAVLKLKSPSCNTLGKLGVAAALFVENKIEVSGI